MCQMTFAQIKMPLHLELNAWKSNKENFYTYIFTLYLVLLLHWLQYTLKELPLSSQEFSKRDFCKCQQSDSFFEIAGVLHQASVHQWVLPSPHFSLAACEISCSGATRKGKWKSLTRKILKGAISIDQEHHNITFRTWLSFPMFKKIISSQWLSY